MFNIKPHKEKLDPSLKQMNWEEARKHADQTGATESGSNQYGIEDGYFNSKIKKKLKQREGYLKMMLTTNRQNMKIYKLYLIY